VFPHSGAHGGLCQFENDGGNPANQQRDGILEYTPGQRVRREQRSFARRPGEVDRPSVLRLQEGTGGGVQPALQAKWQPND